MAAWQWLTAPRPGRTGPVTPLPRATQRTLTLRSPADQDSEASFTIRGDDPAASAFTELADDLVIIRDGQFLFRGRIMPTADTLDSNGHALQAGATDYRALLRRRRLYAGDTVSWTSTPMSTICWQMITATQGRTGGSLGITQGHTTAVNASVTFAAADFIGDKITQLCQLASSAPWTAPAEWQIQPYSMTDLRFDFYSSGLGADNGVILTWGARSLVESVRRTIDPSAFADSQYVTGDPSLSLTPVSVDAADIATRAEGRWDQVTGTDMKTQLALNSQASSLLAATQVVQPSYTIVLTRGGWGGPDHIWLGDTVTVRVASGRLAVDDPLRVAEIAIAVGDSGEETVTLTAGRIGPRLDKQIPAMLRRIRALER